MAAVAGLAGAAISKNATADVFNLPAGETSLTFQTIGSPNNAADPTTGLGSVGYQYSLGTYDVTASQYCDMLNAVATSSDIYGLWSINMVPANSPDSPGITRTGSIGNYHYTVDPLRVNFPVTGLSWGSAARFCNWLTQGQPTSGSESSSSTETGSYNLLGAVTTEALAKVTRSPNATFVIPTVSEWYKGAYFSPASGNYFLYPTSSNTPPSNVLDPNGTNNANFRDPVLGLTDPATFVTPVGSFPDSPGPFGTLDQGGDVWQWTEGISGNDRIIRGGDFASEVIGLESSTSLATPPGDGDAGFRVAEVPEPDCVAILTLSCIFAKRRRR
jgi:formylglycine-generating enzyme required for sulfatase activity